MAVEVEVINVTKRFGDVVAVDDVSFEVMKSEFFSLLGPSGCGMHACMLTCFMRAHKCYARRFSLVTFS